jgi:hypothetical protein
MAKFKVGDMVRYTYDEPTWVDSGIMGEQIRAGMIGTVLEDHSIPLVKWLDLQNGHTGAGLSDKKDCWCVLEDKLELI